MKGKERVYAVYVGYTTGIFTYWQGEGGGKEATEGCSGAKHKSFTSIDDAADYLAGLGMKRDDIAIHKQDGETIIPCHFQSEHNDEADSGPQVTTPCTPVKATTVQESAKFVTRGYTRSRYAK